MAQSLAHIVAVGATVRVQIWSPRGRTDRIATWKLAQQTNRENGELGISDSLLGPRLLGARVDDELVIDNPAGEAFCVTVLELVP